MAEHVPLGAEQLEEDMSLIDEAMVDCVLLEKQRTPDGAGGWLTDWKQGANFRAAITVNASNEMQVAEAQGLKRSYLVTTTKNAILDYHDVFMRLEDGATFRVTADGNDMKSPASASFSIARVTAERWELPT